MTKSTPSHLYLRPAALPLRDAVVDEAGRRILGAAIEQSLPQLARSLVDFTIQRQRRGLFDRRQAQPLPMAVLNRRRRAARLWLLAIAGGRTDAATRHAVATQWLPILAGTGPVDERVLAPGRACVEFVRGAVTALLFDEPCENLLPAARGHFVLEATLAAHLAALLDAVRAARAPVEA
jgi:hypothetical protein